MPKEEQVARLWTRESILDVENKILQQVMSARTAEGAQAAIAFARFLRMSGLDADNYPLFLKMLEIENHWVLDALIGDNFGGIRIEDTILVRDADVGGPENLTEGLPADPEAVTALVGGR